MADDLDKLSGERMEPVETSWTDQFRAQKENLPSPYRIVIAFQALSESDGADIDDDIVRLAKYAEELGLFFDFGFSDEVEIEDLPQNSPLLESLRNFLR